MSAHFEAVVEHKLVKKQIWVYYYNPLLVYLYICLHETLYNFKDYCNICLLTVLCIEQSSAVIFSILDYKMCLNTV